MTASIPEQHEAALARRDGRVAIAAARAGGLLALRDLGPGTWPAQRPGGGMVAWSTLELRGDDIYSAVLVSNGWSGSRGQPAFVAPAGAPPVIAPGVPHYILWAPQGDRLAVVANAGDGLALHVASAAGGEALLLLKGAPVFPAWSPDGTMLLAHVGGEAVLCHPGDGGRKTLTARATGFRAPAWSRDGRWLTFAVATGEEGTVAVICADAAGEGQVEAARFHGGVGLGFRGATHELAVAVTANPASASFDSLWLVDLDDLDAGPRRVCRGPFAACYWSPGGERLALVVPAQSGDGRYFLRIVSPAGDVLATAESFLPSGAQRLHFGFFDQYVLSHPLWAADGSGLLVCGRTGGDSFPAAFGEPAGDQAFFWAATRGSPLVRFAEADFATFAPPAAAVE